MMPNGRQHKKQAATASFFVDFFPSSAYSFKNAGVHSRSRELYIFYS
jgi:hypothetical protein